ncbi:hypothetical protein SPHINGOAX6_20129 [Sphingomonas sp. AX6]|nr:hypothetical protein SPHINGOAX6_20129 [Sphingomonas sp. AX6]
MAGTDYDHIELGHTIALLQSRSVVKTVPRGTLSFSDAEA